MWIKRWNAECQWKYLPKLKIKYVEWKCRRGITASVYQFYVYLVVRQPVIDKRKGSFSLMKSRKKITVQWCKHILNPNKESGLWNNNLHPVQSHPQPAGRKRRIQKKKQQPVKIFLNPNLSAASLLLAVAEMDEEEEVADIREQIFHNTVREHIVSGWFLLSYTQ